MNTKYHPWALPASATLAVLLGLMPSTTVFSKEYPEIDRCASRGSGADGTECLEAMLAGRDKSVKREEQRIRDIAKVRLRLESEPINGKSMRAHYYSAMTSLQGSSAAFKKYREEECHFYTYIWGGVASGYMHPLLSCKIELTNQRLEFLQETAKAYRKADEPLHSKEEQEEQTRIDKLVEQYNKR